MQRLPMFGKSFGVLLVVLLISGCEATPAQPTPQPTTSAAVIPLEPTEIPVAADQPAPQMLARGLRERAIGDYDAAARDFHALVNSYPTAPEVRPASYYLAESFALRNRWSSAAAALQHVIDTNTSDEFATRALFWLGRCHEESGDWAAAVRVYDQYRQRNTVLAPYARLREAAQLQALGQNAEAAAAYSDVAASDIASGERAGSHEKAIALYRQLGQNDAALKLYANLLGFAEKSTYRARILNEAAAFAREQNSLEQARSWDTELISQFPASAEALEAVSRLNTDPQSGMTPANAAAVYEAHERYVEAIPLLDTAIAAGGNDQLELRRRRALAIRAGGDFDPALTELAAIGATEPNSETGRQAQLDWVQTRGQTGDTQAAIDGYRQFVSSYPDDSRAPEALDRVVILLERIGDQPGAMAQRMDLGQRYPASEQAQTELDVAAWYFYNNGQLSNARAAWEQLARATNGAVAARASFWAARAARESGDDTGSAALLEQAKTAAPDSYYGVRAAELSTSGPAASAPFNAVTSAEQWAEANAWVASWATPVTPKLLASAPISKALALADVGLLDDAIAEWNEARTLAHDQPEQLYQIARLASDNGVPYIGLKAAEDLVALAPQATPAAPIAIRRLIYPTPYAELVEQQAHEFGIDPHALYALLRQESLFNPHATSWVGARGLAQVMPATAEGIAADLQVENFSIDDLYRPVVSVRFGAFYISRQVTAMNGSLAGGLSAYNGGYGNATRWADGTSISDQDLFVETIDYPETEHYVKLVYSYYDVYRELYNDQLAAS